MDARIVRQIVSYCLVSVPQVTRAERGIHHLHRSRMATLGWAIFGCKRQRVLNVGNVLLIPCELLALRFIANEDRGPVRRLHAEYLVKIRFVRREDHIELWI